MKIGKAKINVIVDKSKSAEELLLIRALAEEIIKRVNLLIEVKSSDD